MSRVVAVCFSAIFRTVSALNRITFRCIASIHNFADALLEEYASRFEPSFSLDYWPPSKDCWSTAKSSQRTCTVKHRKKKVLIRSRKKTNRNLKKAHQKDQIFKPNQLKYLRTRLLIPDLEKIVTCDLSKARKVVLSYEFTSDFREVEKPSEGEEGIIYRTVPASLNQSRAFKSKGEFQIVPGVTMDKVTKDSVEGYSSEVSLNVDENKTSYEVINEVFRNLDGKREHDSEVSNGVSSYFVEKIKDITQMKYEVSPNSSEKNESTLEEGNCLDENAFQVTGGKVSVKPLFLDPNFSSDPLNLSVKSSKNVNQVNSSIDEVLAIKVSTNELSPVVSDDSAIAVLNENEICETKCEITESEAGYLHPKICDKDTDCSVSKKHSNTDNDKKSIDNDKSFSFEEGKLKSETNNNLKSEPATESIGKLDAKLRKGIQRIDPTKTQTECLLETCAEVKPFIVHSVAELKNTTDEKEILNTIGQNLKSEIESPDETQNNEKCLSGYADNFINKADTLGKTLDPKNEKTPCSFEKVKIENENSPIPDQPYNLKDSANALDGIVSVCTQNDFEKKILMESLNIPGNLKFEFSVGPPMSGSEIFKNYLFHEDYNTKVETKQWKSQKSKYFTDPAAYDNALPFDLSKLPKHLQTKCPDPKTMTESENSRQEDFYRELTRTKDEFEKHIFFRDNLIDSLERIITNKQLQSDWDVETESSLSALHSERIKDSTSSLKQTKYKCPFKVKSTDLGGAYSTVNTGFQEPKCTYTSINQNSLNTGFFKQNENDTELVEKHTKNTCAQKTNTESIYKLKTLIEQFESRDENKENDILIQWIKRRKVELRKHPFEPLCTVSHSESSPESNKESSPVQKTGKKGKRKKQKKLNSKLEDDIVDTMTTSRLNQNLVWDEGERILTSRYVYDINTAERAGHEFDYKMATLQYLNRRIYGNTSHISSYANLNSEIFGISVAETDKSPYETVLQKDGTYAMCASHHSQCTIKENDAKIRNAAAFKAFESFKPLTEDRCAEDGVENRSVKSINKMQSVQKTGNETRSLNERDVEPKLGKQDRHILTASVNKDVNKAGSKELKGLKEKIKSKVIKSDKERHVPDTFTEKTNVSFEMSNESIVSGNSRQISEVPEVEKVRNESMIKPCAPDTTQEMYTEKTKLRKDESLSLFKSDDSNLTGKQVSEKSKFEGVENIPLFKSFNTSTSPGHLTTEDCQHESQLMCENAFENGKNEFTGKFDSETSNTDHNGNTQRRQSVIVRNDQTKKNRIASKNNSSIVSASSIKSQSSRQDKIEAPFLVKDTQDTSEQICSKMSQQFSSESGQHAFDTSGKDELASNNVSNMKYCGAPPYGVFDMYDLEPTERFEYQLLQQAAAESASVNSLALMLEYSESRILEAVNAVEAGSLADVEQDEISSTEASSNLPCSDEKTKVPKKSKQKKWKNKKKRYYK